MDTELKSTESSNPAETVWVTNCKKQLDYFLNNLEIFELKITLPYGIYKEKKPKDYEKKALEAMQENNPNGVITLKDVKEWKPEQKLIEKTNRQHLIFKHMDLVLTRTRGMYLEQNILVGLLNKDFLVETGLTYKELDGNKGTILRKYITPFKTEKDFLALVNAFITDCNKVLLLYGDTR
jgi:hypothetical protein